MNILQRSMRTAFVRFNWTVCIFLGFCFCFVVVCFFPVSLVMTLHHHLWFPPMTFINKASQRRRPSQLPDSFSHIFLTKIAFEAKNVHTLSQLKRDLQLGKSEYRLCSHFLTESGKKLHFTLKSNLGFIFGSLIIQGVLEMLHVSLLLI